MKIITLQVSEQELDTISRAQEEKGFRSRSEYIRQAVVNQARKDLSHGDNA